MEAGGPAGPDSGSQRCQWRSGIFRKKVRYGPDVGVQVVPPPAHSGEWLTFEQARSYELEVIRRLQRLANSR